MKLTAVNNRQIRQNNRQNNQKQNTSFKGIPEAMVGFWKFVDGSRAVQFTVEDMLGTNIPRTYSGAMSGYEYTGKINWPYLWQEGIREFLTGPTMTCAPVAILALITKMSGKTANTHKDNIVNLSYLADQLPKEEIGEEAFKDDFAKAVLRDALHNTTDGNATEKDLNELVELYRQYSQKTNTKGKANKKEAKKILKKMQVTFERILKSRKESYEGVDFRVAKYTTEGNKIGSVKFTNYVDFMKAYADDYVKANKKNGFIDLTTNTITKFRDNWSGKRIGTVGALIFLTGAIMSFIPKLYTLASGGVNPGGKAIYDEAAKREGK